MGERERTHLAGLDGLRGIAALGVLGYHVSNVMSPGMHRRAPELVFALHQGLVLFFVLSGFLLYSGFAGRLLDGRPGPELRRYALARAVRIWPAYLVVLVVVQGAGLAFVWPRGAGRVDVGTLLTDATLLQSLSPHTIRTGLEVAWTLTVELTFYALLPVLAAASARIARRGPGWVRAILPPLALVAIGAGGAVWQRLREGLGDGHPHGWSQDWESVVSRSLLLQGQLFAVGMAAALVVLAARRCRLRGAGLAATRFAAGVAAPGFGLLAVVLRRADAAETLAALAIGCLLLVVALPAGGGCAGRLARLLDLPAIRWAGLTSYGLYLWHLPVIRAFDRWAPHLGEGGVAGYMLAVAVVASISLALASLTHVVVERPAARLLAEHEARRNSAAHPASRATAPAPR